MAIHHTSQGHRHFRLGRAVLYHCRYSATRWFPVKALEFLAYMAIIVRAERNSNKDQWAIYGRQF